MTPLHRRSLAASVVVGLLGALSIAVWSGTTAPLDIAINTALDPNRSPWLLAVFGWLTIFGTEAAILGAVLAASTLLWAVRRPQPLALLWTTVLGAEATTWALKFIVERPRPALPTDGAAALSPSFPSAHATGITALAGIVAVLAASRHPDRRPAIVCIALTAVLGVGFSRVFLGVHFLTDVVAGILVGTLWLILGLRGLSDTDRTS